MPVRRPDKGSFTVFVENTFVLCLLVDGNNLSFVIIFEHDCNKWIGFCLGLTMVMLV